MKDGGLVEIDRDRIPEGPAPPAIWAPYERPHVATNPGKAPFQRLRVELERATTGFAPPS